MAFSIGLLIIFAVWLTPIVWAWKTGHPDRSLITFSTLFFGPVGCAVSLLIISSRNRAKLQLGDAGVHKCEKDARMNSGGSQDALSSMTSQITGNVLTIRGQSGFLDSLGVIALGVLLLCFASSHIWLIICGLLLIPVGFLMLWQSIPQIGKPLLVLSHTGFEVPGFGFIPWSAVQTIYKHVQTRRGLRFSAILNFCVPDLKSFESQFHASMRLLPGRKIIPVVLRNCDMKPDDILSVARQLWTDCTGRDDFLSSSTSDEFRDKELKNLETLARELSDPKLREEALRAIDELKKG
jgi:hypothetical protein